MRDRPPGLLGNRSGTASGAWRAGKGVDPQFARLRVMQVAAPAGGEALAQLWPTLRLAALASASSALASSCWCEHQLGNHNLPRLGMQLVLVLRSGERSLPDGDREHSGVDAAHPQGWTEALGELPYDRSFPVQERPSPLSGADFEAVARHECTNGLVDPTSGYSVPSETDEHIAEAQPNVAPGKIRGWRRAVQRFFAMDHRWERYRQELWIAGQGKSGGVPPVACVVARIRADGSFL